MKTAIRLVADSLKEKKLPGTSEFVYEKKEPELPSESVLVPISEETTNTLTEYDPNLVKTIQNDEAKITWK